MIVVNGVVSDAVKQKLLAGETDTVAHRHGNLIIAGYGGSDGNIWDAYANPIEQGSISSSTGGESDNTTRLRTKGHTPVKPGAKYKFETNLARVFIIEYADTTSKPIGSSGWKTTPFTYTMGETTNYIRLTLAHESNSAIGVGEFEWMKITEV